ncbi:DEDDh family exonuclease [Streptomyces sp. NBC_00133]|uniref:DEDDh family exonuclease n=1 Tax=Streptomyces sp. NBC_00133 TaxID=2903624 RepID=UPI003245B76A
MDLLPTPVALPRRLAGRPEWAVVDVETSGLRPWQHRVLSVAVLTLSSSGELLEEFSTLLDPGCDPGPVHIHGLTSKRLSGAPAFEEVADQIGALLTGRVMVAHNAQFDYDFLAHEFARARSWLPVSQRLCTLALNRRVSPATDDLKLATLAAHYGVRQQQAHDALDDARVLAGVLRGSLLAAEGLGLELPLMPCPPKQGSGYPPRVPKTPCAYMNPGRLPAGGPLMQGMKIAFTGDTRVSREELVARAVAAGLNVVGSVSRHTSAVVTNERDGDTAKTRAAQENGVPMTTETAFIEMLADVLPGTSHKTSPVHDPQGTPFPGPRSCAQGAAGPFIGRRFLVLGGQHDDAALIRTQIAELGGSVAVNLSTSVTDAVVLPGGENDRRMPRITARNLPLRDASWLQSLTPAPAPALGQSAAPQPPEIVSVLPRGGVIDLPHSKPPSRWSVAASWGHQTSCQIDVVAFIVDEDEQVPYDEDFVFYGAPESPNGTVRLATEGPCEQAITVDLAALPDAARKVVIAAAIDGSATFADVGAIEITIAPGTSERAVAEATLDAATTERSLVLAELYRRGPIWRARAVGQGYDYGLASLARGFGVDITD